MGRLSRTIWVPRGDTDLAGVNTFTSGLKASQFVSMDPQPAGNDSRQFNLAYENVVPPYLVTSSIKQGTYLNRDYVPDEITLLMSTELSQDIVDGTFTWRLSTGAQLVSASAVTFDGLYVVLGLPDLSSYEGSVILTAVGLRGQDGTPMSVPISLSFEVGASDIYPTTETPNNYTEDPDARQGDLKVTRLIVPNGDSSPENMIQAFKANSNISDEEILQIVHRGGENTGYTDVYIAWFKEMAPRPVNISPTPHTTLSSDNPPSQVVLSFGSPVENLTTDDVVVEGSVASYSVEQLNDEKTQWAVNLTGVTVGQVVMKVTPPNAGGRRFNIPRMYAWQIIPRVAPSGSSMTPFCDTFTGDGVTVDYTLSHTPIACSWHVFVNGISSLHCVTLVGTTLTFGIAPFSGAIIIVRGWY